MKINSSSSKENIKMSAFQMQKQTTKNNIFISTITFICSLLFMKTSTK